MKKINKIVFIVRTPVPRVDKRIQEFINRGYSVDVYGFEFENVPVSNDGSLPYYYNVLATLPNFPNQLSYRKRLTLFASKIKEVIKKYDKKKTLFYFFTLNTSIYTLLIPGLIFINEESDMLFDRAKKQWLRELIKWTNKRVIKKSFLTVFTSQGFADYYFGEHVPQNIYVIPNKVNGDCLKLPKVEKSTFDENHIRFGFTGNARYDSIFNMCKMVADHFPQHEFHFYGTLNYFSEEQKKALNGFKNCTVHGKFKNPDELPVIYSNIDFLVGTYDVSGINPRYAESNKIYEAMFFETPIIVSKDTVLAKIVNKYNIGCAVDALKDNEVIDCIRSLTKEKYDMYRHALAVIPKTESVNENTSFFNLLESKL